MRKTLAFILLIAPTAALADDAVSQAVGHGQVNWTDKTVTATGSGAPSLKAANVAVARLGAERAAKMDAYRNVLEAVRGIRVSGTTSAGTAIDAAPELKAKIEGLVQGFKVIDTRYYSDGGVDVVVQGPLDGVVDALVTDTGKKAVSAPAPDDSGTTGVIVNAKGTGALPALAPRLVDEAGNEVYASKYVKVDAMHKQGMVVYQKSIDKAQKDNRIGQKPIIVKAVRATENGSSDLVIANADIEKLSKARGILGEGKVIIVTD